MDDKSKNTQSTPTPTAEVPKPKTQLKPAPNATVPQMKAKGLSKGALWGIIGGSIGLVVLIIGIVLAVVFLGGPSKDDYKAAHEQMTSVRSAYLKVGTSFRSVLYGSSSASADDIKEAITNYKSSVDKLKGMKALRDKDVKQKYDEFVSQNEKFTTAVDELADASDEILAISKHCRTSGLSSLGVDRSKMLERYDSVVGPCSSAVKKLSKVKNESIASEAKKLADAYDEQRTIVEELQNAYNAGNSSGVSAAASKLYSQASKFRVTDSSKKLNEAFTKAEVTSQLNALGRTLTDKVNQS